MKTRFFLLMMLLLVAALGSACGPQPLPSPADPDPTAAEPGSALFSDDFSNASNPSAWGLWSGQGAVVEYHSGGLRILVQEPQYDFWSVPGRSFTDVQIETDAVKLGGPDDNDFGLICRYQNEDNFYMLVISSDGYYGIAKLKDGQYSLLGADELQFSSAIAQGQAANNIRADCIGPTLRLYANGVPLAEVQDSDFASGDVGLIAGSYSTPGVDILFDNFMVRKPE